MEDLGSALGMSASLLPCFSLVPLATTTLCLQCLQLVVLAIAAGAACCALRHYARSARATQRSANATRDTAKATLAMTVTHAFSTSDFRRAFEALRTASEDSAGSEADAKPAQCPQKKPSEPRSAKFEQDKLREFVYPFWQLQVVVRHGYVDKALADSLVLEKDISLLRKLKRLGVDDGYGDLIGRVCSVLDKDA